MGRVTVAMSSLIHTISSTAGTLILAPLLLLLCIFLFPFAFLTTYLAFVALGVRAILVQAQVVASLVRHWLGIDDDSTSTSAWVPKDNPTDIDVPSIQRILKGKSAIARHPQPTGSDNKPEVPVTDILHSQAEVSTTRGAAPLSTTSGTTTPASPTNSRPGSTHSSYLARDYEGVGGWYNLPANSASKPETSSSLEWLHMNARLELPDADASSLTRPRTPEEGKRSLSISGRSHRSTASLHRRHHHRSTTASSIEFDHSGEIYPIELGLSRPGDLRESSHTGILGQIPKNTSDTSKLGSGKIGESKHKSMISLGEKGSRFAYKLVGWKPLSLKKKSKNESMSSPEESAGEELSTRKRDERLMQQPEAGKSSNSAYEVTGDTSTPAGSAPGSVEGAEIGNDLTMWMSP